MSLKNILLNNVKNNVKLFWESWREELNKWQNYNKDGKILSLFGAASMGEKCSGYLERLDVKVDVVLDNSKEKQGIFLTPSGNEIRCCSPLEIHADDEDMLCILTTGSQHMGTIKSQLSELGINNVLCHWHIDFLLESLVMIYEMGIDEFCSALDELFNYYEDDNSYKILWLHFKQLFDIKDIPAGVEDVTFETVCVRPQYFLEKGKYLGKQNVMLDCGAFVGDTLEDLIYTIKYDSFEEYCCFELDQKNFKKLQETISKLPKGICNRIITYNLGVGEQHETLSYVFNHGGSVMAVNGDCYAEIVKIDDICENRNVTFIKMDIEGSETQALAGAEKTIKKDKPMCAICIYHNVKDFWTVPRIIKEYVPEYVLKLSHHTTIWDDSVCYAIYPEW